MKQVPDRKRLRRRYLWKRTNVYTSLAFWIVWFCIALGSLAWFIVAHVYDHAYVVDIMTAGVTLFIGWALVDTFRRAKRITVEEYIPPVTPSTLPAEEVLVRGAQEPSAPSETLLRATVKGEETKTEELLRVVPGATGERDR